MGAARAAVIGAANARLVNEPRASGSASEREPAWGSLETTSRRHASRIVCMRDMKSGAPWT
ncbi:hypothetical protein A3768_4873 (plasmid) [Ralstonia solanacearum]|nr:hypothetical protein F504_4667 [Ralstonia pseudosolanacearum FQY_4]ANH35675.1 hypothetical protein A3768_4873 [Ralstonia solanacearum]